MDRDNKNRIRKLHKFTDKSKTLKKFVEVSHIAILSSYYIYIARDEPAWTDPAYISPPSTK